MVALPKEITQPTVAAIYDHWVNTAADWRREHIGASQAGKPCTRALWYTFRWAYPPRFLIERDGRMLRLFNRGQLEERVFGDELRGIGVEFYAQDPSTGKQFEFSVIGGHAGGSMDGVGRGFQEAPKSWHVCEFKTHSAKSFAKLVQQGVEKAKPEHFAQMMLYMHWTKPRVDRAMYLAVNKDTDELYSERIRYDKETAKRYEARLDLVVRSETPPPRIKDDPTWWECRFCDFKDVCHGVKMPMVSCRTCAHATPELDGDARWSCAHHGDDRDPIAQREGCDGHRFIPHLIQFAEYIDGNMEENWARYRLPNGVEFVNGRQPEGFSSEELRAPHITQAIGHPAIGALRSEFGATLVDAVAGEAAVVSSQIGPQEPHPTQAGKDWGWIVPRNPRVES